MRFGTGLVPLSPLVTGLDAVQNGRLVEIGAEGEMKERRRSIPAAMVSLVLFSMSAWAQTAKELKTKSGSSVVLVNFVSARTDCSSIPGPITVPVVRDKPTNGIVQMVIVVADVAASGKCAARKIPTTALIYTPNKDFVGTDSVQIEVENGNQTTALSYRITVQAKAEQL